MGSQSTEDLLEKMTKFLADLNEIMRDGHSLKNEILLYQRNLAKKALQAENNEQTSGSNPETSSSSSPPNKAPRSDLDLDESHGSRNEESIPTISLEHLKSKKKEHLEMDVRPSPRRLSSKMVKNLSQDEVDLISKLTCGSSPPSPRTLQKTYVGRKPSSAWTDMDLDSPESNASQKRSSKKGDALIKKPLSPQKLQREKRGSKETTATMVSGLSHSFRRQITKQTAKLSARRTSSVKYTATKRQSLSSFGLETKENDHVCTETPLAGVKVVRHNSSGNNGGKWNALKTTNDASNQFRNHGLKSFAAKNAGRDFCVATEMNTLSKIANESPESPSPFGRRRRKRKIVSMDNPLRRIWDFYLAFGTMYAAFAVPVSVAFRFDDVSWSYDWITLVNEIAFILDIPLMAHTSYMEQETKEEIMEPDKVLKNYLKNFFLIDFISSIPWHSIFLIMETHGNHSAHYLPLLTLVRLWKLYSRSLWEKIHFYFTKNGMNPAVIRMTALVVIFTLVVHYLACFYWFLHIKVGYSESWAPISDGGKISSKYIESIYFALSSVEGNHMGPHGRHEFLLASLGMLIAIGVNATLIGSATIVLSNLDSTAVAKKQQTDSVRDYLKFRRTPKHLQHKILSYYDYLWETGKTPNSSQVLRELPRKLNLELSVTLHKRLIEQVPLFKACSSAGVILLIKNLKPMVVLPNELVIRQGERGTTMYFISRGSVKCTTTLSSGKEAYLVTLSEGSYFGEMALIEGRSLRTANIRAINFCELQMLAASDFRAVLDTFPDFKVAVDQIADARLKLLQVVHNGKSSKMRKMGLRHGLTLKPSESNSREKGDGGNGNGLRRKISSYISRSRTSNTIFVGDSDEPDGSRSGQSDQNTLYESVLHSQEGLSHDTAAKMKDEKELSICEFISFEHAVNNHESDQEVDTT